MRRRLHDSSESNIWSSFVDLLSNLLIILLFLLLLFVISQFFLSFHISTETSSLSDVIEDRAQENKKLNEMVLALEGKVVEEKNLREEAEKQTTTLKGELQKLNMALQSAEAQINLQKIQMVDLGKQLNRALANKTAELSKYQSEFFGQLSTVLGENENFRVVGDRYVLQSEVLFQSGSAHIEKTGLQKLDQLLNVLKDVIKKMPEEMPWILRVDGHTDIVPIGKAGSSYKSNWELSAARAVAVVKYLESKGIPAKHLAATGFGEFQPLEKGNTPQILRRNRRIEFKITER